MSGPSAKGAAAPMETVATQSQWKRKLPAPLAMLSGVLLVLTFPDANFTFLAPFALAPLLYAVTLVPRVVPRLFLGWICGIVYWLGACYWIQFTLANYGDLNLGLSMLALALFALIKALHMAVFGLVAGWLMQRWWAIPATAAAWVAIERTHGPLGFAWQALGNAGIDMGLLMRLAPLVGVYGLSFAFAMLSAGLVLIVLRRPRLQLAWLLGFVILYLLPPLPESELGRQQALLVQPNVNDQGAWTGEEVRAMQNRVFSLSTAGLRVLERRDVPLVIWPEMPAPVPYYADPEFRERTHAFAKEQKAWFLFGTVGYTPQREPKNSAVLIDPDGNFVDRYDKTFLVPFGEFVPPLFEWVGKVSDQAGNFVPGDRTVVFPMRAYKMSAIICYESAFPHLVRRFPNEGAEVLANLSYDGYFGNASARRQHLGLVRMRAAENRRWLLRATSDGITVNVDPAGRIVDSLPQGFAAALPVRFNYIDEKTPYTIYGDWFCLLCAAVAIVALVPSLRAPARD
ncbi:MAG: apolipoprotein N-acyltransferase [Bryobacterales bacterium]|nr:apolipoprotein N-acyltransferase [Bryobacterales bacterium]